MLKPLSENSFSVISGSMHRQLGVAVTGRVTTATPFSAEGGQKFLAVGSSTGVFVGPWGESSTSCAVFACGVHSLTNGVHRIPHDHLNIQPV
jgi:hypothetical protein